MLEEALHSAPNLALKPASHYAYAYAAAAAQAQFDDRAKYQEYPWWPSFKHEVWGSSWEPASLPLMQMVTLGLLIC